MNEISIKLSRLEISEIQLALIRHESYIRYQVEAEAWANYIEKIYNKLESLKGGQS
jgi:hypothetical protein